MEKLINLKSKYVSVFLEKLLKDKDYIKIVGV